MVQVVLEIAMEGSEEVTVTTVGLQVVGAMVVEAVEVMVVTEEDLVWPVKIMVITKDSVVAVKVMVVAEDLVVMVVAEEGLAIAMEALGKSLAVVLEILAMAVEV